MKLALVDGEGELQVLIATLAATLFLFEFGLLLRVDRRWFAGLALAVALVFAILAVR